MKLSEIPHPFSAISDSLPAPSGSKPRLLDQIKAVIRAKHYSRRTEEAYLHWARQFILFHGKRHPLELSELEVGSFLQHLAVKRLVAASTQNQGAERIGTATRQSLKPAGCPPAIARLSRVEPNN